MNLLAYFILFIAAMSCFIVGFSFAIWLRLARIPSENPLLETLLKLRHLERRAKESKSKNEEVNHYLTLARAEFEQALEAWHFPMEKQHNYKRAVCSFHIQNARNLLVLAEGILDELA